MATYKTFSGLMKAVDRTVAELESTKLYDLGDPGEVREYKAYDKKVSDLLSRLGSLWSDPADVAASLEAARRLNEAWIKATN